MSLHFDIQALIITGALTASFVTFLALVVFHLGVTYPGYAKWLLGNALMCAGYLFLTVRATAPVGLDLIAVNIMAITALALFIAGSRQFRGLKPIKTPYIVVALEGLSMTYFTLIHDSVNMRVAGFAGASAILDIMAATIMLRKPPKDQRVGFWMTGAAFATQGLVSGLRAFSPLFTTWRGTLAPTPLTIVYWVGTNLATITLTFGFMLLTKNRLVSELVMERDTTRRMHKELERAMLSAQESAQRAEHSDRAKSEFLAYMSHEIRTPLNGILGMSHLLLSGPITEEKRSDLTTVHQCSQSLLAIINDVLDLSKIDAGEFKIVHAPFSLSGMLRQVVDLFKPQAAERRNTLHLLETPNDTDWMKGDELRLRQVVSNFVSNAIKFTQDGIVEVGARHAGTSIEIFVRDNGIGISTDALPRLFQRFSQADALADRKYGGTGLGLAISKRLATLMDGDVGVTSTVGQGSEFWVRIPLEESLPATPVKQGPQTDLSGLRVLVAEDNAVNQKLIIALLEKRGLQPELVVNGAVAADHAARKEYDVILMDCHMPLMDGFEVTRQIRQREAGSGRHTPVIALTASPDAGVRCAEAGMDAVLTKPIRTEELFGCLAEYCRRS